MPRCGGSQVLQLGEQPKLRGYAAAQVVVVNPPARGGGGAGSLGETAMQRAASATRAAAPTLATLRTFPPPTLCHGLEAGGGELRRLTVAAARCTARAAMASCRSGRCCQATCERGAGAGGGVERGARGGIRSAAGGRYAVCPAPARRHHPTPPPLREGPPSVPSQRRSPNPSLQTGIDPLPPRRVRWRYTAGGATERTVWCRCKCRRRS